jgi:hypothetical protein
MLPEFTANAALTGPRNVYHGRTLHEPTDSAIVPQRNVRMLGAQNARVLPADGGGAEPPCVCPCCLPVPGLGLRCCTSG